MFCSFLDSTSFYLVVHMQFSGLSYSTTSPFPALKTLLQYIVLFFSTFLASAIFNLVLQLFWTLQRCTLSLSCPDSTTSVLCFPAFWTLRQCTLFLSFLDSATMYVVSQLSGLFENLLVSHSQLSELCNNVLCFSAFWTQLCTLFLSFLDFATM